MLNDFTYTAKGTVVNKRMTVDILTGEVRQESTNATPVKPANVSTVEEEDSGDGEDDEEKEVEGEEEKDVLKNWGSDDAALESKVAEIEVGTTIDNDDTAEG